MRRPTCARRGRRLVIVYGVNQPPRPHRPAPYADLTAFIDAAGGVVSSSPAELAAATTVPTPESAEDGTGSADAEREPVEGR